MNKCFVKTKEYGELLFDEIFHFYDEPIFFSVINPLGHRFVCALEYECDEFDRFLLVPVSFVRYQKFVRNEITIRDMFLLSEMGGILAVCFYGDEIKTQFVDKDTLSTMNLPPIGEYLDIKESYTAEEILRKAHESNSGLAQISFEKNGTHLQSIKAKELSLVTAKLQKVINGIAKDWCDNEGTNFSAEKRQVIKNAADIRITKTYAASFGIEIESEGYRDIFGESAFDTLMERFAEINYCNEQTSREYYSKHQNSISAIRDFYKALMLNSFAIKFQAALPQNRLAKVRLTTADVQRKYNHLSAIIDGGVEQVEYSGRLIAFDIKNKTFKFQLETGETISGKVDEDFNETIFDMGNQIKILVNRRKELSITEETQKFVLLQIL